MSAHRLSQSRFALVVMAVVLLLVLLFMQG
jgi:hypothetical protein